MRKRCTILLDMDGTLSDSSNRVKYLLQPVKDWEAWNRESKFDAPNLPVVLLVKGLFKAYKDVVDFVIFTGRPDELRKDTLEWLESNIGSVFSHQVKLYMRKTGDHTPDHVLKQKWLKELRLPVLFAIDDRSSVVQMYRNQGITVLQCADGDY